MTLPHLADPSQALVATDLIATFGAYAAGEAAARAGRSRDLGNYVHYCRWRQIGRLVELLQEGRGARTLH